MGFRVYWNLNALDRYRYACTQTSLRQAPWVGRARQRAQIGFREELSGGKKKQQRGGTKGKGVGGHGTHFERKKIRVRKE